MTANVTATIHSLRESRPMVFSSWRAMPGASGVALTPGGTVRVDPLSLATAVRKAVGDHYRLMLDSTWSYNYIQALRVGRALEEGVWPENEPPARALVQDGGIPQPDRVRIRAWAEVAASYLITDPRAIDALSPYYIWTTDYAEKRLAWKRRHPLHVIVLRTYRIPRPVTVKVKDAYGGCRSWCEIQRDLPFEGTPVLSDDEFERASEEILAIRGGGELVREPVLA